MHRFSSFSLVVSIAAAASGCNARAASSPTSPAAASGLPQAANAEELPDGAPVVSLDGSRVTVDGAPAGDVAAVQAAARIQRIDPLFDVLKAKREAWKQAHPGAPFPGVVVFRFDQAAKAVVVKSAFQTAAFAGYPNGSFMVQSVPGAGPTRVGRLLADAQVPHPPRTDESDVGGSEKVFHVDVAKDGFVMSWTKDGAVLATVDVPRATRALPRGEALRFPELAAKIGAEWKQNGQHTAPADKRWDQAVVFVPDDEDQRTLIATIDAVYAQKRSIALADKSEDVPAFNVTLAMARGGSPSNAPSGRLAPEVIQRVVRANFGTMRVCYEAGLKHTRSLRGRVEVRFVIDRDGKVSQAEDARSTDALPDSDVVACVVAAFGKLVFPRPDGGIVTVQYPIVFAPGD